MVARRPMAGGAPVDARPQWETHTGHADSGATNLNIPAILRRLDGPAGSQQRLSTGRLGAGAASSGGN